MPLIQLMIQHFRIPIMTNYQVPLIKLFQIAYNAGQLKASQQLTEQQGAFYKHHHLGEMSQYM